MQMRHLALQVNKSPPDGNGNPIFDGSFTDAHDAESRLGLYRPCPAHVR